MLRDLNHIELVTRMRMQERLHAAEQRRLLRLVRQSAGTVQNTRQEGRSLFGWLAGLVPLRRRQQSEVRGQ
ncbi:MAG: hypothetical protein ACLFVO_23770 [Chloroflexaceae bacterium]